MKCVLTILASIVGLATSVFGQGQVLLANNASSLVLLWNRGVLIPAPAGSLTFQLYVGHQGGGVDSLTPVGPTVGIIPVGPGRIASTIIDISQVAPGSVATFQIPTLCRYSHFSYP